MTARRGLDYRPGGAVDLHHNISCMPALGVARQPLGASLDMENVPSCALTLFPAGTGSSPRVLYTAPMWQMLSRALGLHMLVSRLAELDAAPSQSGCPRSLPAGRAGHAVRDIGRASGAAPGRPVVNSVCGCDEAVGRSLRGVAQMKSRLPVHPAKAHPATILPAAPPPLPPPLPPRMRRARKGGV